MTTFNNGESGSSVRTKINSAITSVDSLDTVLTVDSGHLGVNEASPTANLHVGGDMILDVAHPSSTSSLGIGTDALEDSSAVSATAIGVSALKELTTGARNTAVGNLALRDNTSAANSTAVGYNALVLSNGAQNQAFGAFTLDANTTGIYNCAYGYASLGANVSGNYNVAVGGRSVLTSCVSGIGNVAVGGYVTLGSLDDGDYNVAVGYFAGQDLQGGSNNVLLGRSAGLNIVDADSNVCVGYVSGNDISSGQVNTCVGFNAGNTLTTGSNNTLLGRDATPSAADVNNEITLGSSSATAFRVPGVDFYIDTGDVGIGTSSPTEALEIAANSAHRLLITATDTTMTSGADYGGIAWETNDASQPGLRTWEIYQKANGTTGEATLSVDYKGAESLSVTSSGLSVAGSLSKGSGSFKIDHPLKPDTHHLVHSFVEGPQADNLYRGKAQLVGGRATVNLDDAGRMSEGTFVALNGNLQCFTTNESGWTQVRGTISGNVLTIEAQDSACADMVSWLVIGERHDQHMIDTEWTDENGRVITEPERG